MFYRSLLKELERWRTTSTRKPLVIRGARQVGKTTLVNEFGKQFKQYIYLNLEHSKDAALFQKYSSVQELVTHIFFEKRAQLSDISETLLFIDEIQEDPKVVNLLRYFKEEMPDLPVIAAGSMLETLLGKNLTFPVGRVEFRVLRPVSFVEYLKAMGEDMLLEAYQQIPIPEYAESALYKAFHDYALLGGMPEIIQHYAQHRDLTALAPIYDSLINSYLSDAEKYAKNDQQLQLIRFAIHQTMVLVGQRITFQRFGNSNYPSNAVSEVLRALEKTHLLHVLYPTTGTTLPLENDYKKSPRLQFLDTGLVNYFNGLQLDVLGTKDLSSVYQGRIIEHLVGQELLSFQSLSLSKLNFWVRQKKQSDAELDFIHAYRGRLIPIEVKSGPTGTLKSLQVFMDQSPLQIAIRYYAGTRRLDKIETQQGKPFYLLSLPYFLSAKIDEYLDWIATEIDGLENEATWMLREPEVVYQRLKSDFEPISESDLSEKHLQVLELCASEPQRGRDLIEKGLELSYQTRNKKIYINALRDLDFLEFTIPEYEKSKEQRYRLTEKGREFLISKTQH
jgi:predicted AAA+ superfamily ATPase/predicted transcriptional regulator